MRNPRTLHIAAPLLAFALCLASAGIGAAQEDPEATSQQEEAEPAAEPTAAPAEPAAEPTAAPAEPAAEPTAAPAEPAATSTVRVPSVPVNVQATNRYRGVGGDEMVIVTWEGDGDYYRVFRSESARGPFEPIGGNVNGTEYRDYEVERDDLYYYRVQAFIIRGGESEMSEVASGRADLSPHEFIELALRAERNAHRKLRLAEPEPGIGTDVTVQGDRGGTARWTIEGAFLQGRMRFAFDDYDDFGLVINGTTGGNISIRKNGENAGTLNFSGSHQGQAIWQVEIRRGDGDGGGFMVIYPLGSRPVWVPWDSIEVEPLPEITPREEEMPPEEQPE
ncbi:MAG: hypothetical protein JW797_12585 [Bradymonadales bacterium]|nr:hypothetical protein [Bradymonadales bacterium]